MLLLEEKLSPKVTDEMLLRKIAVFRTNTSSAVTVRSYGTFPSRGRQIFSPSGEPYPSKKGGQINAI